jgi:hypothetical protein
MKIIIQLLFLFIFLDGFSQETVKHLKPLVGGVPDLSAHAQKAFQRRDNLLEIQTRTPTQERELDSLLNDYSEAQTNVWDIIDGGCSWYCGGGPYKVTASSELDTNYRAEYAHDLSFKSVWAEGKKGDGAGEYLTYYFENTSPRINKIIIYNGYSKTEDLWKENSRVKALKLYVNDKLFAILELEDKRNEQSFSIPLLGRRSDGKELILKFEIADIYPGTKYSDTVITELFFDGIDVH